MWGLLQKSDFKVIAEYDRPAISALCAGYTPQQGCFAHSVFCNKSDFVAFVDSKGDIGEEHTVSVAFCQIFNLQVTGHINAVSIAKVRKLCIWSVKKVKLPILPIADKLLPLQRPKQTIGHLEND